LLELFGEDAFLLTEKLAADVIRSGEAITNYHAISPNTSLHFMISTTPLHDDEGAVVGTLMAQRFEFTCLAQQNPASRLI
jgi:hypothetical protein